MRRWAVIVPLLVLIGCQRPAGGPTFEIRGLKRSDGQHEAVLVARGGGAEQNSYLVLVSSTNLSDSGPRVVHVSNVIVYRGVGHFRTPARPGEQIQLAVIGYAAYAALPVRIAQTPP